MAFGTNSGAGCPALVSATSLQGLHEQFNWNNSTHRPYCNGTPLHLFSAKECLLLMQLKVTSHSFFALSAAHAGTV